MKPFWGLPFLALLLGCKPPQVARALPNVDLPAPKPWSPPKTGLPPEVADEAAFLLAHGMGDPRGGEYRAAKVVAGTVWGHDATPEERHGWVSKDGKRMVAPNGLVYDVVARAGKADLEADVQAVVEGWNAVKGPKMRFFSPRGPVWGPIGVRLLLVAGEVGLAERLGSALPGDPNRVRSAALNEFLSNLFDQAVTAHMRGDDATALRVSRGLAQARPDFERRALALNGPQYATGPRGQPVRTDVQFAFLDPVPALLADTERRLRAAPRGPFDPKTASVAELVDHLDDASARQMGQPGGVNMVEDPIVAALVAKGDEAVEPLLAALEKDGRLTRSVSFARDFMPYRNLITAKSAAYAAFRGIAQTDELPPGADGKLAVAALRAYWQANRGKTPPERLFDTLADDKAGWRRWEEAERRLFDPQGTRRSGYTSWGPGSGKPYAEALRGRTNPSLNDLLERRARDMVERNDEGLPARMMLPQSLHFVADLGRWDPPRCVAVGRELTRQTLGEIAGGHFELDYVGTFLVPVIVARAKAGDATAWRDYLETLKSMDRVPSFDSKFLRPLIDFGSVPEVREAAKLLTTPGSIFDAVGRIVADPQVAGYDSILVSPVLKLPAVRAEVLKALDDRRVIGTSWIDERGNGWVEANGKPGPSQGVRPEPNDPKPPAGEKRPLRAADAVALALARLKGAPRFQPFWTPAEKDAALTKMRAFFVANEGHVDDLLDTFHNWKSFEEIAAERQAAPKPKSS